MNKLRLVGAVLLMGIAGLANAQTTTVSPLDPAKDNSGLRISVRGGYDFPSYHFGTPYIDHKGGVESGASLDYYWKWFGIGADFDYIQNKPKSTFPTSGYQDPYDYPINKFTLTEDRITRLFYGIGPDFRFLKTSKSEVELKLRGGLSSVKGGETQLIGQADNPQAYAPILLNYHGGFDDSKKVFAGKSSLQYNYFFSQNVGFNVGGYFLYHPKASDLKNLSRAMTTGHAIIEDLDNVRRIADPEDLNKRVDPIQDRIQSFGAFVGLIFKFNKKAKIIEAVVPEARQPTLCSIIIMSKDKYTGAILPNSQVILLDANGNTVKSGQTDAAGKLVFANVKEGKYSIRGTYQHKDLEDSFVAVAEFGDCSVNGGIKKDLLLNDENFMVKGIVVNCKTEELIPDATIVVKNNTTGTTQSYNSDARGEFSFTATPKTTYTIYGKKANYLSETVHISTNDYDRGKSQYIQLRICMEKVECNDAIVLKNILYDLDKSFIREDAKPELDRLVQFMEDNSEVRVELSSHTDSRGSDVYNMKLSQRRAQAAVDYIISRGIAKNRIVAKGYGETKLLNNCGNGVKCTEVEHQLNRRTEMKVLCPDKK